MAAQAKNAADVLRRGGANQQEGRLGAAANLVERALLTEPYSVDEEYRRGVKCQHDNRPKKNDDRCQRNTDYKFSRFVKRSGSDSLLHLCARELSLFEASNWAWVGNSFLWQGSPLRGKALEAAPQTPAI